MTKRIYQLNIDLFDKAVHREYRVIQRFFDMEEAEVFKERFKDIRDKIIKDTATSEELLEVASVIKRNQ